jgi:hypothetical protein
MPTGLLVGLMALLAIVCVYFWLVRKRGSENQQLPGKAGPEVK